MIITNESLVRDYISSLISENRIIIDEKNNIDPEVLQEIISLSKIKSGFKSLSNIFKASKEEVEENFSNYEPGTDKKLEKDIANRAEELADKYMPEALRMMQELEVEIYSKRWLQGYNTREKEIDESKSFNESHSIFKDKAVKKGYYDREEQEKSGQQKFSEDEKKDAAVEAALIDYDEDKLKDFIQNNLGEYLGNLNPLRVGRILKFFTKGKKITKGFLISIVELSIIALTFYGFYGFFKDTFTSDYIHAIVGLVPIYGIWNIIQLLLGKFRDKLLVKFGENEKDLALKKLFISNSMKPISSSETELVQYEKRNSVEVPLSGDINNIVYKFDFTGHFDEDNPQNILADPDNFNKVKLERQNEIRRLKRFIRLVLS